MSLPGIFCFLHEFFAVFVGGFEVWRWWFGRSSSAASFVGDLAVAMFLSVSGLCVAAQICVVLHCATCALLPQDVAGPATTDKAANEGRKNFYQLVQPGWLFLPSVWMV
ncbi:unnamed protein product [Urochloa humidicola]